MADEQESQEIKEKSLIDGKEVSRRDFLKYAGIAGAAIGASGALGGILSACGGGTTTTTAAATTTTAGGGTATTAASTTTVSAGPTPPSQDKITIGASRPISGVNAFFEQAHFGPAYKLWVSDVNAAGGINVAGKKLPVEMKVYDDQSNLDNATRNLIKLMEQDKVDFVFGPCSTAFTFAAAGVCNAHKYILMGAEGGATTLEKEMENGNLPYYFQCLSYSDHNQMPVMAQIMQELGIKTTAFMYIDDLHGIEYSAQATVFMGTPPLSATITSSTAVPPGIKDVSSIIKKIQGENPDLLCSFQYPPENALTLGTMAQLNYNPKAVLVGPGGSTQVFYDGFKGALDGIMFEGAWTPKMNPTVEAYYEKLQAFTGVGHENVDFWGPLIYRAQLEFFQQAIEEAATLDQDKIAEVMRKAHYKTTMSDDTFFNPYQIFDNSCYAGQIGQWQNGYPEVIDPGDKRTTDKIWYPKPTWADAPGLSTASTT
jgi:branched-chain amino acid transport system substrate-binding protein